MTESESESVRPEFGSIGYQGLVDLGRQICAAKVILSRLNRIKGGETDSLNHRRHFHALQNIEDYSLIMHLDRIWRTMAAVRKAGFLRDRAVGSLFATIAEDVKILRNKREHSEDYLDRKKLSPWLVVEDHFLGTFETAPDWSSTMDGVRKLGGRVSIANVQSAVEQLEQQIVDRQLWLLPWRPYDLVQAEVRLILPSQTL